ncbi:MAG: hypothetical protein WD154_04895 [Nitrosopumilaceae archaeon]
MLCQKNYKNQVPNGVPSHKMNMGIIAETANVTEVTIRNRYKGLKEALKL